MSNPDVHRKFKIKEILDQLPVVDRKKTFANLVNKLDIHPNSLHRIMGIKSDSKDTVAVDKMKIIADSLNVTIDDLINSKD